MGVWVCFQDSEGSNIGAAMVSRRVLGGTASGQREPTHAGGCSHISCTGIGIPNRCGDGASL